MDKITMTPLEVASLLGISRTTIYSMIRFDEIPHSRIRGKIVFHKPTIEKWLIDGATKNSRGEINVSCSEHRSSN